MAHKSLIRTYSCACTTGCIGPQRNPKELQKSFCLGVTIEWRNPTAYTTPTVSGFLKQKGMKNSCISHVFLGSPKRKRIKGIKWPHIHAIYRPPKRKRITKPHIALVVSGSPHHSHWALSAVRQAVQHGMRIAGCEKPKESVAPDTPLRAHAASQMVLSPGAYGFALGTVGQAHD